MSAQKPCEARENVKGDLWFFLYEETIQDGLNPQTE